MRASPDAEVVAGSLARCDLPLSRTAFGAGKADPHGAAGQAGGVRQRRARSLLAAVGLGLVVGVVPVPAGAFGAAGERGAGERGTDASLDGGVAKRVDVNHASVPELMRLPGIGRKRAEAIVAARDKRPFSRVTQLLRIRGIGRKTLYRLRPYLAVTPRQGRAAAGSRRPGSAEVRGDERQDEQRWDEQRRGGQRRDGRTGCPGVLVDRAALEAWRRSLEGVAERSMASSIRAEVRSVLTPELRTLVRDALRTRVAAGRVVDARPALKGGARRSRVVRGEQAGP